ncbi:MAG TPA: hypothetical protein VMR41_00610 [Patescibacteria group bacterium]|nr:hypothetical protein [Patescibacteria group bacterium]
MNTETLQTNGTASLKTFSGVVGNSYTKQFTLEYKKDQVSSMEDVTVTTFDSTLSDISNLYKLKKINIFSYESLTTLVKTAEENYKHKNKILMKATLKLAESILKAANQTRTISADAYTILSADINALMAQ